MAVTATPRFGLPQWGEGTDSPSRAAFNDAFDAVDDRAAYDDGAVGGTTLPASEVVNGRYAQTVDGVHRRLFRRAGGTWQQVGGNSWAETVYARADAALATGAAARITSHPSLANPGATENWDGSSVRGGRQAVGDLNSGQPGALHVGDTASAVDLAVRGRIYARTTAAGQRGIVASAHADTAGPLFTARTAGGDPWQVDAQGRMRAQAPAAFGAAALATGVPLVSAPGAADTTAADLFADVGKPALRLWRAVGDVTPIGSIEQTRITLGRSVWSGGRVDLLAPNVNVVGAFDVTGDSTVDRLTVGGALDVTGTATLGVTNTGALTGATVTATGKLTAQSGVIESVVVGDSAELRSLPAEQAIGAAKTSVRQPMVYHRNVGYDLYIDSTVHRFVSFPIEMCEDGYPRVDLSIIYRADLGGSNSFESFQMYFDAEIRSLDGVTLLTYPQNMRSVDTVVSDDTSRQVQGYRETLQLWMFPYWVPKGRYQFRFYYAKGNNPLNARLRALRCTVTPVTLMRVEYGET